MDELLSERDSAPAISVALHSFVTAGLLPTSLAASILALSAANLVALGDQTSKLSNLMFSDPSRNLLGTTEHLQVFVLPIDHGLQIVPDEKFTSSYQNPCALEDARLYKQHKPSMKDDPYGLPLEYFEYFVYFLRGEPLSAANVVQRMENYTGYTPLLPAAPVFVRSGQNDPSHLPEWTDSGQSGIRRMRAIISDESYGESTIPAYERLLGCGRSFYIVLDLLQRAGLGVIAGAYSSRENSTCQSQLIIAFIFTVVQFLYLFIFKPYLRRGFQLVESVSLVCEAGVFGLSFYIDHWDMYKNQRTIGRVLLALLFTSFASQLMNEWYALIKCLLLLPQTQKPSLKLGLKWVLKGLILPLLPKKHWARLVPGSTQPKTGLAPVVPLSSETDSERRNVGVSSMTATVVPVYSPGSPELTNPRGVIASTAQIGVGATTNVGLVSQNGFTSNKRSRTRIMEEKKPKGLKLEPKDEMKKLQKLAMASFARSRQGGGEASSSYAARELCSNEYVSDDSARH